MYNLPLQFGAFVLLAATFKMARLNGRLITVLEFIDFVEKYGSKNVLHLIEKMFWNLKAQLYCIIVEIQVVSFLPLLN